MVVGMSLQMISEDSPTTLVSPMKNPLPFSNDGLFTIPPAPIDIGIFKTARPCGLCNGLEGSFSSKAMIFDYSP